MQPRGAATCDVARALSFRRFDKFSDLAGQHPRSTKTFACSTGGPLKQHTKAKDIRGQLVCLTGGSIPVTMITRKLFAELSLGEIP